MKKIVVIGIGAGNPEHMTVQAVGALNRADVLLIPTKGDEKAFLAEARREICDRFLTNPDCRLLDYAVPVRRAFRPTRDASNSRAAAARPWAP